VTTASPGCGGGVPRFDGGINGGGSPGGGYPGGRGEEELLGMAIPGGNGYGPCIPPSPGGKLGITGGPVGGSPDTDPFSSPP
jgi:hypothetical protein